MSVSAPPRLGSMHRRSRRPCRHSRCRHTPCAYGAYHVVVVATCGSAGRVAGGFAVVRRGLAVGLAGRGRPWYSPVVVPPVVPWSSPAVVPLVVAVVSPVVAPGRGARGLTRRGTGRRAAWSHPSWHPSCCPWSTRRRTRRGAAVVSPVVVPVVVPSSHPSWYRSWCPWSHPSWYRSWCPWSHPSWRPWSHPSWQTATRQTDRVGVQRHGAVTAWPASASSRPLMVAPVVAVIEVSAKMVPTKVVLVPSVADCRPASTRCTARRR